MIWIRHRALTLKDLELCQKDWGVEIDLRSDVNRLGHLHLAHDPWVEGLDFKIWLQKFKDLQLQGPIILNTKEDGLESSILSTLKEFNIESFFFLDTAFPTLVNWTQMKNEKRFALRVSHYEPLENVQLFKGRAEWIWLDCFQGIPLPLEKVKALSQDFRICLVSPELQGQSLEKIKEHHHLLTWAQAVCTKSPTTWTEL